MGDITEECMEKAEELYKPETYSGSEIHSVSIDIVRNEASILLNNNRLIIIEPHMNLHGKGLVTNLKIKRGGWIDPKKENKK